MYKSRKDRFQNSSRRRPYPAASLMPDRRPSHYFRSPSGSHCQHISTRNQIRQRCHPQRYVNLLHSHFLENLCEEHVKLIPKLNIISNLAIFNPNLGSSDISNRWQGINRHFQSNLDRHIESPSSHPSPQRLSPTSHYA